MRKSYEPAEKLDESYFIPRDPEEREMQMISLATALAEKQLREGTASSQVITHYLKLGTQRERVEREILEKQKELITAKTEALKTNKHIEELYEKAIGAIKRYNPNSNLSDSIESEEDV